MQMTRNSYRVTGGLCLLLDPTMGKNPLLEKMESSLLEGIQLLQIWNRWPQSFDHSDKTALIEQICKKAHARSVPVLINQDWELLEETMLDGVHFDHHQSHVSPDKLRSQFGSHLIVGITCGNQIDLLKRAEPAGFDYISFCSMFPSHSAPNCELIQPETVINARLETSLPLFVAGGITPENLHELSDLPFDGIAVVSGILQSSSAAEAVKKYRTVLEMRTGQIPKS